MDSHVRLSSKAKAVVAKRAISWSDEGSMLGEEAYRLLGVEIKKAYEDMKAMGSHHNPNSSSLEEAPYQTPGEQDRYRQHCKDTDRVREELVKKLIQN